MKKLEFNSTPYVIENKGYSTITFEIIYPCKYDKKNIFDNDLIRQIVMNTSYQYKTEQQYKLEKIKRLIISLNFRKIIFNDNLFFIFSLTVPDPKRIKDFNIDESFKFFYDTIYNPNVVNEEFDHKHFEREKDYIKFSIQNSLKNIYTYSYQRFLHYVDDIGILKDNVYSNIDLLEKITPNDLYNYYMKHIINNSPICIIYGNIDKQIIDLYYKYFKVQSDKIEFYKDYDCYLKPSKVIKEIEENSSYNQSVLYMAYKIENMSENDKLFFELLCNILDSKDTNLIFKKLRLENNLIYSHRFNRYSKNGMIVVEAYIDKINKEKTISAIKELFIEINDKNLILEYINRIVKGMEYSLIDVKDSKYYKLDKFIDKIFEFNYSLEDIYSFYKDINLDEFIKFLERVKLDTIYFLKGDGNEE